VLGWVAALMLGFFVTGPIAAFATWLWIGGTIVLVVSQSSAFTAAPRE
jgi:hypothetical protein